PVNALEVYNGELYAGGQFTTAGGAPASSIARWNGTAWQPVGFGVAPGAVSAFTVFNGELIVGGSFSFPTMNVARWNGSSWNTGWAGVQTSVSALTVYHGDVIASGSYSPGPWRLGASPFQALGGGTTVIGSVDELTVFQGDLIAAGNFGAIGGTPVGNIARWDGSAWHSLGFGVDGPVYSLAVYEGALITGGLFWGALGGAYSPAVARWSSPLPLLDLAQPGGAGNGVQATNRWL